MALKKKFLKYMISTRFISKTSTVTHFSFTFFKHIYVTTVWARTFLNHHSLTFREHPVDTLQVIQAESYEMKLRFSSLLWMPSFDTDIFIPAAGVPSIFLSKYPCFTGESGRWQSTSTKSVIMPGNRSSDWFGVQELLTTCACWDKSP